MEISRNRNRGHTKLRWLYEVQMDPEELRESEHNANTLEKENSMRGYQQRKG